jgi:hypothetical protein
MSYRWSGDTRQLVFINEANQQTIIADNLKGFTISWKLTDAAQGTQYIRALQMDYQTQAAPTVNQQILVTLTNMPAKDGGSTTTVTNTYNFN